VHVRRVLAPSLVLFFAFPLSSALAAAGDLDTSFSGDGQANTGFGTAAQAEAVAMQGKKIMAGGFSTKATSDFALVRYTAGGKRDLTFGKKGRASVDFGHDDTLTDLAILSNGKILAVGEANKAGPGSQVFAIARFTVDGKLDRTFGGGDGKVTTSFGDPAASADAVVLLSGGRFAVAGGTGDPSGTRFAVARYLPGGKLDTSFGGDGRVVTGFWPGDEVSEVRELVRWGDLLLAVGESAPVAGNFDVALARYGPDGKLDTLFGGGDGKATEDVSAWDYPQGAVLQKNGFFIVGGITEVAGGWDAMFLRFNASGHLDLAWGGGDGLVTHDIGGVELEYWFELVKAGSRVVVAGQVGGDASVLRILKSGALDTSFGGVGWVVTAFSGGDSTLQAVTIQGDGKIVGAGQAPATLAADGFAVERLLAA
jgi:uncharacterized delta-60 repeat protein